jgi:hypothetical protein
MHGFPFFSHNQYILEPLLLAGAHLGSVNYVMDGVPLMALLAARCSPVGVVVLLVSDETLPFS